MQAFNHLTPADTFEADRSADSVAAADYAGAGAARWGGQSGLPAHQGRGRIHQGSSTPASRCGDLSGPWTLIEADVVRGRRITSWPSLKTDLVNAGANWVTKRWWYSSGPNVGVQPQARRPARVLQRPGGRVLQEPVNPRPGRPSNGVCIPLDRGACRRIDGCPQHRAAGTDRDLVTDDFVDHGSPVPLRRPDGYIAMLTFVTNVLQVTYEVTIVAAGDMVAIRATAHGVNAVHPHGGEPTGRPFAMKTAHFSGPAMALSSIRGGDAHELDVLYQVGVNRHPQALRSAGPPG